MDSDEDAHEENPVNSIGDATGLDYCYSDDDTDVKYVAGDDAEEFQSVEHRRPEKNFIVLKESDILHRQDDDITKVCTVLSISRDASCALLRHYNWSVSKVHEEWFSDEERVRKAVGLLENPVVQFSNAKEATCGICFDSFPCDRIKSATCGHPFCSACWQGYISTSINDGPGCLLLRCPDPPCHAFVGQDMIYSLVSSEDKEKYVRYLRRSYIEDNKKIKWCPAPGCEHAINFIGDNKNYDVSCLCSHTCCWNCTEEAHRPVDCGTVAKWILKDATDSKNFKWILANSKPCPKCKRPIEKNQGCMIMTCAPPCRFRFCWLCLRAWEEHGLGMGGPYVACNRYLAATQRNDEAKRRRVMAMSNNSMARYLHYFERWASNRLSMQKALSDLHQTQTLWIKKLSEAQSQSESKLNFVTEAWQQIVQCRRVLKWTYAYGFYLPEHENAKRQFFEYLQGEAESALERLHQCAEKELQQFFISGARTEGFTEFRVKLAGLTRVTKDYFENLVRALEDGLPDVGSQAGTSNATSSKSLEGPIKVKSEPVESKPSIRIGNPSSQNHNMFLAVHNESNHGPSDSKDKGPLEEQREESEAISPSSSAQGHKRSARAPETPDERQRAIGYLLQHISQNPPPVTSNVIITQALEAFRLRALVSLRPTEDPAVGPLRTEVDSLNVTVGELKSELREATNAIQQMKSSLAEKENKLKTKDIDGQREATKETIENFKRSGEFKSLVFDHIEETLALVAKELTREEVSQTMHDKLFSIDP